MFARVCSRYARAAHTAAAAVPSGSTRAILVNTGPGVCSPITANVSMQLRCISASAPVYERLKKRQSPVPIYLGIERRNRKRRQLKEARDSTREKQKASDVPKVAKVSLVLDGTSLKEDFKAIVESVKTRQGANWNLLRFMEKLKETSPPETVYDDVLLVTTLFKLYHKSHSNATKSFPKFLNLAIDLEVPELVTEVVTDRVSYGIFPTTEQYDSLVTALLHEDAPDTELACDMLNMAAEDPAVLVAPSLVTRHFTTLKAELDGEEEVDVTEDRLASLKDLYSWTIYTWAQQNDTKDTGVKFATPMECADVEAMVACCKSLNDAGLAHDVIRAFKKFASEDARRSFVEDLQPLVNSSETSTTS